MDIKTLVSVLLKLFKATPVTRTKPNPQDPNGTISIPCKSTAKPAAALSQQSVLHFLSSANFGKDVTVEDLDVRVTPLKLALGEKAFYVSIFLALNVGEEVKAFNIAYSTQGRCIHITPLE